MEKMDKHLLDVIVHKKCLSENHQRQIYHLFNKLDDIGVFHNDANICNYMLKGNRIYLIDYGYAKDIDNKLIKQYNTDKLNTKLMLAGFMLKLQELNFPIQTCTYFLNKMIVI